jgi:hypothetical protein
MVPTVTIPTADGGNPRGQRLSLARMGADTREFRVGEFHVSIDNSALNIASEVCPGHIARKRLGDVTLRVSEV